MRRRWREGQLERGGRWEGGNGEGGERRGKRWGWGGGEEGARGGEIFTDGYDGMPVWT